MARKERRSVGFAANDYETIAALAEERRVPMTQMIMHILEETRTHKFDWGTVRESINSMKISYADRVKRVEEILEKFGEMDDARICEFTGYSLSTVESITHTAQKRCIAVLKRKKDIDVATLAEKANVSPRMAERVQEQFNGTKKIPEREQYLFATGRKRVTG